jgi:hypothetical protein
MALREGGQSVYLWAFCPRKCGGLAFWLGDVGGASEVPQVMLLCLLLMRCFVVRFAV